MNKIYARFFLFFGLFSLLAACGGSEPSGSSLSSDNTNPETYSILQPENIQLTGSVVVGDYNGDGFSDLAINASTLLTHPSGTNNPVTRFLYGSGNGTFDNFTDLARTGSLTYSNGNSSDINNDGVDDYTDRVGNNEFQAHIGTINNLFQLTRSGPEPTGNPNIGRDLNGDGFIDFVSISFYTNSSSNSLAPTDQLIFNLYRGNGDGTFSTPTYFADRVFDVELKNLSVRSPLSFIVDDFNGDLKDDILLMTTTFDSSGRKIGLLMGNGDATFTLPTVLDDLTNDLYIGESGETGTDSKEMISGDFDSDGDIDIAITSTTSFIQIMLNDGSGSFVESQRVLIGVKPIHIYLADFNNDSVDDLISINETSKTVIISYGNGNGTFGNSDGTIGNFIEITFDNSLVLSELGIADFDNDGFLDFAIVDLGLEPTSSTVGQGSIQIFLSPGK